MAAWPGFLLINTLKVTVKADGQYSFSRYNHLSFLRWKTSFGWSKAGRDEKVWEADDKPKALRGVGRYCSNHSSMVIQHCCPTWIHSPSGRVWCTVYRGIAPANRAAQGESNSKKLERISSISYITIAAIFRVSCKTWILKRAVSSLWNATLTLWKNPHQAKKIFIFCPGYESWSS